MKKQFLKIGHRGARGRRPENTLAAFMYAYAWRADAIEFDVRATKDGALVVFHDATLERLMPGCNGRIKDLTLEEIRQFRIQDQTIPTLMEVCEQFGKDMMLNIELKESGLQDRVLEMVRGMKLTDSVIVSAFARDENNPGSDSTWQDLFWIKTVEPRIRIALIAEQPEMMNAAIFAARDTMFPIYSLNFSRKNLDAPMAQRVREETGAKLLVWTVNAEDEIKFFKRIGVDGIFSDYPELLL